MIATQVRGLPRQVSPAGRSRLLGFINHGDQGKEPPITSGREAPRGHREAALTFIRVGLGEQSLNACLCFIVGTFADVNIAYVAVLVD